MIKFDTISDMFNVIKAPNPILRTEARVVKKITPKYLLLVEEMIKTAKSFQDPEGVGLAATQVGISEQFFIAKFDLDIKEKQNPGSSKSRLAKQTGAKASDQIQFPEEFTAIFNPRINWFSKRFKVTLEGCLSIPDYYGEIARSNAVKVTYTDINGQIQHKSLKGMNATIFQHEYDHLHGKLFMDYVIAQSARLFKITGKDATGADIYEEVKI